MIGKILGGRYEIIEQIGGGGMARVYKAKCHLLKRYVAIKILRDEFVDDEDFIRKFKRESQAAASLSHPNIMNIYDVGVENIDGKDIHYIVMEYIKGKTLKEIIKEKGKLSFDETVNFALQIAEALQEAHSNHIVHRDIKPQNIMVTEDNRIKVTDFGIARAATSATLTTTSNVLGSVHYFSPEQARGGYTDEKSDIYSLGIVMYEMITGKLPYDGETPISVALKHVQDDIIPPRDVDNTIPVNFESIILKCVQKKQGDRYANARELIRDLKNIGGSEPVGLIADSDTGESPTRMIPIIADEGVDEMEDDVRRRKKKKRKKKKKGDGGVKVILSAILLAFLLVTVIFVGYLKLRNFFDVSEVVVPKLLGETEESAREILKGRGLELKIKGTAKSNEFKEGEIMSQVQKEGSKVKKGFPIEVVISEGEDLVKVPGLLNMTLAEAEEALRDVGLKMGQPKYESSDITPEDLIMGQDPDPFSDVAPGSRVIVVVSKGEEIEKVIMPDLIEHDIIEAKNTILSLGLKIGEVKPQPSNDILKDHVVWQSYNAGTELETETAVDLYVSTGPDGGEDIGEPDTDDGSRENSSRKESSFKIDIIPFTDRDETEVVIIRRQDGATEEVYRGRHKASDGEQKIKVRGKTGAEFEVFFDDIYQFTRIKE
ncbi:MAG: Stk1 family PASTA domain-containing Ser/Thr kinase [Tissierellaceae bacterium]